MRLSTGFEQACCVLAVLTVPEIPKPVTNEELTKIMDVSPTYLKKITRKLVVAKLITSTPGVNGGFILGRHMNDITLYDVIEAIDGDKPFFRSAGIIERVFTDREQQVEKGMTIIEESLHSAQNRWKHSLKQVTLCEIVKEVLYV